MAPQGQTLAQALVEIGVDEIGLDKELETAKTRVNAATADMSRTGRANLSRVTQEIGLGANAAKMWAADLREVGKEMGHIEVSAKRAAMALSSSSVSTSSPGVANGKASNSAYGFLLLSQGIEDAQYGMRALSNNVPGIIMAFGGGSEATMKFAGTLSLLATAATIWVQNWDHVKDIVGDTSPFKAATDALNELTGGIFDSSQRTQQLAMDQERLQQAAAARSALSGIGAAGESERGAAFRKAVEEYGGGEKLREDLLRKVIGGRKLSDADRAKVETGIDIALGNALRGRTPAKDLGMPMLTRLYNEASPEARAATAAAKKESDEARRETERAEKAAAKAREDEVARHARNMAQGPIGRMLLSKPDADVGDSVRKQLKAAGGPEGIASEVAAGIARALKAEVGARMEQTGEAEDVARIALLNQRLGPMTFNRPNASQVMNGSDVWRAVQTSGMKDFGNDPQLRNLVDINKNIKELVKQGQKGKAGVVANPS